MMRMNSHAVSAVSAESATREEQTVHWGHRRPSPDSGSLTQIHVAQCRPTPAPARTSTAHRCVPLRPSYLPHALSKSLSGGGPVHCRSNRIIGLVPFSTTRRAIGLDRWGAQCAVYGSGGWGLHRVVGFYRSARAWCGRVDTFEIVQCPFATAEAPMAAQHPWASAVAHPSPAPPHGA